MYYNKNRWLMRKLNIKYIIVIILLIIAIVLGIISINMKNWKNQLLINCLDSKYGRDYWCSYGNSRIPRYS